MSSNAAIGGQAVFEGVMMRGPSNWALAVRKPNGEIAEVNRPIHSVMTRHWFFRLPIVRGLIFAFAIAIGFALMLFKVTPALITSWLPIDTTGWFVLVEGLIRVCLFI